MNREKDNNPPLTLEQLQGSFEVHRDTGLAVAFLGEDGETALILGHHPEAKDADIAAALASHSEGWGDAEDYSGPFESRWLVAREHQDACEEYREDDREEVRRDMVEEGATEAEIAAAVAEVTCSCDEYQWHGTYSKNITAETPGAIAVTVWSA